MSNTPVMEKLDPDTEAKFREKIKTQIGLSRDLADSFGGKPKQYLKSFNKLNRDKIRSFQVGVVKGLQNRFRNIPKVKKAFYTSNLPLQHGSTS
jgi:hypothetical protein